MWGVGPICHLKMNGRKDINNLKALQPPLVFFTGPFNRAFHNTLSSIYFWPLSCLPCCVWECSLFPKTHGRLGRENRKERGTSKTERYTEAFTGLREGEAHVPRLMFLCDNLQTICYPPIRLPVIKARPSEIKTEAQRSRIHQRQVFGSFHEKEGSYIHTERPSA